MLCGTYGQVNIVLLSFWSVRSWVLQKCCSLGSGPWKPDAGDGNQCAASKVQSATLVWFNSVKAHSAHFAAHKSNLPTGQKYNHHSPDLNARAQRWRQHWLLQTYFELNIGVCRAELEGRHARRNISGDTHQRQCCIRNTFFYHTIESTNMKRSKMGINTFLIQQNVLYSKEKKIFAFYIALSLHY